MTLTEFKRELKLNIRDEALLEMVYQRFIAEAAQEDYRAFMAFVHTVETNLSMQEVTQLYLGQPRRQAKTKQPKVVSIR